jgi:hypothetical protein
MGSPRKDLLDAIDQASPSPKRHRGPPRMHSSHIDEYTSEAHEFVKTRCWTGAGPGHLVGLYVICHEHVYGVPPLELDAVAWTMAKLSATKLVTECFDGDVPRAASYVQWVWTREQEREQWRRRNGAQTYRVGWRLVFASRHLFTDYIANLR